MTSSDSDSDCNIYTNTEEKFKKAMELNKKRKETMFEHLRMGLQVDTTEDSNASFGEEENHVICIQESGCNDVNESIGYMPNVDLTNLSPDDSNDSDIPLSEIIKISKRKSKITGRGSKRRGRPNTRQRNDKLPRPRSVICFDDDAGYEVNDTITRPIVFNSQRGERNEPTVSKENVSTISLDTGSDENDDIDDLITIRIKWNNGKQITHKQFKLHRYQNFVKIYEEIAQSEGVSVNNVLLFLHDFTSIKPTDTLSSLSVGLYVVLTGYLTSHNVDHSERKQDTVMEKSQNSDCITIKLLLENKKNILCPIAKHQKMDCLFKKCCEELQCDKSKIKITFDGECIEPDDLLTNLDVEDEDVFHVHVKQ